MSIRSTIARIRCHTTDPVATRPGAPTATVPAIEDLLARLEQLVTIDDNAPSAIDGYPTKTPGAAPSDTIARIDLSCIECGDPLPCPEHGLRQLATDPTPDAGDRSKGRKHQLGHNRTDSTTIVERSAVDLIENGNPRDVVHRLRVQAETAAEKIAHNLTVLAGTLARYDKVRQPLPIDTPQCFVAVLRGLPLDEKWIPGATGKKTRFERVIDAPFQTERLVCRWTYDFTRRWRRLPTEQEMREYLATGYVKINESLEAKSGRSA